MYDELILCTYILIKIEERPARILEYQIVRNLGVLRNHACYSLNNFAYLLCYAIKLGSPGGASGKEPAS